MHDSLVTKVDPKSSGGRITGAVSGHKEKKFAPAKEDGKQHATTDGDGAAPAKKRFKVRFKSREVINTDEEDGEVKPSEHAIRGGKSKEKAKEDSLDDQEESQELEELKLSVKVGELRSATSKAR